MGRDKSFTNSPTTPTTTTTSNNNSVEDHSNNKNNDRDNDDDCQRIWNDLVSWVMTKRGTTCSDDGDDNGGNRESNGNSGSGSGGDGGGGGYVHPALRLQLSSSSSSSTGTCSSSYYRGVYAAQFIKKGELLIRIPTNRYVLSGQSIIVVSPQHDEQHEKPEQQRPPPSPWLRCVAAYLQAEQRSSSSSSSTSSSSFRPYFESLPKSYDDTLLNWTSTELDDYLMGTTLHRSILGGLGGSGDESECNQQKQEHHPIGDLREPYEHRVVPFLKHLGIYDKPSTSTPDDDDIDDNDETTRKKKKNHFEQFIRASQCISTRGFHMTTTSTTFTSSSSGETSPSTSSTYDYDGPFLLPVIDLLNHDPSNKCTTLQRRTQNVDDDNFYMIAERDIAPGEEVVHSYGDELTSAQLLQTFGFVPSKHTDRIINLFKSKTSSNNTTSIPSSSNLTPLSFDKKSHILGVCEVIKTGKIFVNNSNNDVTRSSNSPYFIKTIQDGIRKYVTAHNNNNDDDDDDDEDPTWDIHDIPHRPMNDTTSDEFLIKIPTPTCGKDCSEQQKDESKQSHHLLTNELLSFIISQYLPDEAYEDIFCETDGNGAVFTHLDHSILEEDPFLRLLVTKTLQIAIKNFVIDHGIPGGGDDWTDSISGFIDEVLLLSQNPCLRDSERRRLYGKTIVLEELYHLEVLNEQMKSLWDSLAGRIWDPMEARSTWLSDVTLDSQTLDSEKDESPAAKRLKKAI